MDLHLDLTDEEVEYLEENGIPHILTENLTESLKDLVISKPPDLMVALAGTIVGLEYQQWALVQGIQSDKKSSISHYNFYKLLNNKEFLQFLLNMNRKCMII